MGYREPRVKRCLIQNLEKELQKLLSYQNVEAGTELIDIEHGNGMCSIIYWQPVEDYNFDVVANWDDARDENGDIFHIVDQDTFVKWLERGKDHDGNKNGFSVINITNFNIQTLDINLQRITCYLRFENKNPLFMNGMNIKELNQLGIGEFTGLYVKDNIIAMLPESLKLPDFLNYINIQNNDLGGGATYNANIPFFNNLPVQSETSIIEAEDNDDDPTPEVLTTLAERRWQINY